MGTVHCRRLLHTEDKAPNNLYLLMELPKSTHSVLVLQLSGNGILYFKCKVCQRRRSRQRNEHSDVLHLDHISAGHRQGPVTEEVHRKAINNLWAALVCPTPAGHH